MKTYVHQDYTGEDTVSVSTKAVSFYHGFMEKVASNEELNLLAAWEVVRQLGGFIRHDLSINPGETFNKQCLSRTSSVLDFSVAYFLYSMTSWVVETARNLTTKVRNELLTQAAAATLLPNKDEVLGKIATMNVIVGFPRALDTSAKMDAFWKEFPDVAFNKFLRVWLQARRKRILWLLHRPHYYIFPSSLVRTYYDSTRHLLLVPPSVMTTYFYGVDSLASLNFAGLGHFLGTGLAETVEMPSQSDCRPETVGPLLGLQAAYAAYVHSALQDSAKLPLVKDSSRRLFFLAACLKTCGIRGPRGQLNSEHCNAVLRNMDTFAETYNCSAGTKMNPKDKCKPW